MLAVCIAFIVKFLIKTVITGYQYYYDLRFYDDCRPYSLTTPAIVNNVSKRGICAEQVTERRIKWSHQILHKLLKNKIFALKRKYIRRGSIIRAFVNIYILKHLLLLYFIWLKLTFLCTTVPQSLGLKCLWHALITSSIWYLIDSLFNIKNNYIYIIFLGARVFEKLTLKVALFCTRGPSARDRLTYSRRPCAHA